MPSRCLIVEDEIMFAQMLAGMLRGIPGLSVEGMAHTRKDALDACAKIEPDILVLDLKLPDGQGIDVARKLAKEKPGARVIILSAQAATFVVPPGLYNQVHAVVEKTKAYEVLQREILQLLAAETGAASADPLAALSPRERDVFRELGRGLMNKQIAAELGISEATVGIHRKRIAAKLNARGSELIRLASLYHRADA